MPWPIDRPGSFRLKCPEGTPIASGLHQRVPQPGQLWRVVGVVLAGLVIVAFIFALRNYLGKP